MVHVQDGPEEKNREDSNGERPQAEIHGMAGTRDRPWDLSASSRRWTLVAKAGVRPVPIAAKTRRHSVESATQALASLPYIRDAETDAPDYWALPATGGYESGYTNGIEMAEACLSYLRGSPSADTSTKDGYTHLFLVISRLAERIQGVSGTEPTSEASMTLKGHLAGFCSALEATCRRPSQPEQAASARKPLDPVPRTPGRGKRCR
jgi:hypothetical protein